MSIASRLHSFSVPGRIAAGAALVLAAALLLILGCAQSPSEPDGNGDETVPLTPQHDGVIVDMLDAYAFCEGAWSEGVPVPLDAEGWVDGQEQLLASVRAGLSGETTAA